MVYRTAGTYLHSHKPPVPCINSIDIDSVAFDWRCKRGLAVFLYPAETRLPKKFLQRGNYRTASSMDEIHCKKILLMIFATISITREQRIAVSSNRFAQMRYTKCVK